MEGPDGNLYGTTYWGGTSDNGTVFGMTPGGTFTTLHSFTGGNDGGSPRAGLVLGPDGNFYGTTYLGGLYGKGSVFRLGVLSAASPRIHMAIKRTNTMTLTWGALAERVYRVQYKKELTQVEWSDLGSPVTATKATATATDPDASDPQRFYRVVLLP